MEVVKLYKCKLFTEEQVQEICNLHTKHDLNSREIADKFNCANMTIVRILQANEVYNPKVKRTSKNKHTCWKFSKEIIDLYNEGSSTTEIAKVYGCNHKTIIEILSYYGIGRRCPSNARQQYNYPTDTFKCIDTEEKAYWLGFLYADGSIHRNEVALGLHKQDEEHLIKFKLFMGYEPPIKYPKPKCCRVFITNQFIAEDLVDKGCFRRKSSILKFPTERQVPRHLINHFMRGYFDGDGSLSKYVKRNSYSFSILGTLEFLCTYQDILIEVCGCSRTKLGQRHPDRSNNNYTLTYGGRHSIKNILDFLYKDATVYLDRKYTKYLQFIEDYNKVYDIV